MSNRVAVFTCGTEAGFVSAVGQPGRLQQSLSDFQPDYFSLTEKPPEEFCLSPNASTSSSSGGPSKTHISVDLAQKRGEARSGNVPSFTVRFGIDWNCGDMKQKGIFLLSGLFYFFIFSQLCQVW